MGTNFCELVEVLKLECAKYPDFFKLIPSCEDVLADTELQDYGACCSR